MCRELSRLWHLSKPPEVSVKLKGGWSFLTGLVGREDVSRITGERSTGLFQKSFKNLGDPGRAFRFCNICDHM